VNERTWRLKEAEDWIIRACMEKRRRTPNEPCLRLMFPLPVSPDAPPDTLIREAFVLLEAMGVVTGGLIQTANAGPIGINRLCLTPQAVERIEAHENEEKPRIGFDDDP